MEQSVFIIGEIYSEKYIETNKGNSKLLRCNQNDSGVYSIHLMYDNYDIWFIMNRSVSYTSGKYNHYKCVFAE